MIAVLIALGLSGPDLEGGRPADDQVPPFSLPVSSEITWSTQPRIRSTLYEPHPDQQRTSSSTHWLLDVFNQDTTRTPLEDTGQSSICFDAHLPGIMARLEEAYGGLIEFMFEDGDLMVRFYCRPEDGRSTMLCSTILPVHSPKDSCHPLTSLTIARSGPFLLIRQLKQPLANLFACLKFSDYEGTSMKLLCPGLLL